MKPEWVIFMKSYLHKQREVGTPFSCSTAVAKEMISRLPADRSPHRYLEVGPGTGNVTKQLIKKLGPNDQLDIVEIEEGFYHLIKEKYGADPRVSVYLADIANWRPEAQYDAIISGVPLNNLPNVETLNRILSAYEKLAKRGAEIACLEYVGTSTIGLLFRGDEFKKVIARKREFFKEHKSDPVIIWMNFPVPARVHHLKIVES
jgi:phosphatidylethanolamine/phosphatidyl-N-methylethanolamine N-methyltransferase